MDIEEITNNIKTKLGDEESGKIADDLASLLIHDKSLNDSFDILEKQTKEDKVKEYMILGLRKIDGVKISEFEQKFGINPLLAFRFEIEKLVQKDLIEIDLDNIKLTKNGLDFANIVFTEFV